MARKKSKTKQAYNFLKSKSFWTQVILWTLFGLCLSFLFNSATYINAISNKNNTSFGGTIISLVILLSGVFFTPVLGFFSDILKKSKEIVLLILLGLSIVSWFFYSRITSEHSFWLIFFPSLSLFYTYRNISSGRLSLNSETDNIPFGMSRSTFYIGYGAGSFLSLYILDHDITFYFKAFAIITLIIFLYVLLFSTNPSFRKRKRRLHKHESKGLSDLFHSKAFIYGIIILGIIIGIFESQDFILQRITSGWATKNGSNAVLYKSYADLFAIPCYFLGFYAVWLVITKKNFRSGLFYLAFIGFCQVASSFTFLLLLGKQIPSKEIEILYDLNYGFFQGFFGGAILTIFFEYFSLLSTPQNRFKTLSIAGGTAFGLFTWLFTFSISHLILPEYSNYNVAIIQVVLSVLALSPLILSLLIWEERILKLKTKTVILNRIK